MLSIYLIVIAYYSTPDLGLSRHFGLAIVPELFEFVTDPVSRVGRKRI